MAKKKTKKDKSEAMNNAQKLGIGVGLTAAAVTAAGAYFLYGSKDASDNRKKIKSWTLKAKAEVLETLENAKHITEEEFHELVEGVTDTYSQVQKLSKKEASDFKKEMIDNWEELIKSGAVKVTQVKKTAEKLAKRAEPKKAVKKATKTAKKTTKKAVNKTAKKVAKKAPVKKAAKKVAKKTAKKK